MKLDSNSIADNERIPNDYAASFVTLLCASVLALGGCEEDKDGAAAAASAAAAPTPTPTPVAPPEPEPEPEPEKKKKTLADCTEGPVVDFDGDEALEAQVRLKLDKPEGDIKVRELGKIRSINLSQTKVHQLDPCIFPHFKNVKDLFLGAGGLEDLSPIAELTKMEALRASLNDVVDLKPLAKLTKMDRLDLGHTKVTDLSPLADMKNLTELQLDDTPVEDLSPLAGLEKLKRLSIQRTRVKSVAALKNAKELKFLYTAGAPVDDIETVGHLRRTGLKIISE